MRVPWLVVPAVLDAGLSVPMALSMVFEFGPLVALPVAGSAASVAAIVLAHRGHAGTRTRSLLVFGAVTGLFWVLFWLASLPPLALLPAARVALVVPFWHPPAPAEGALPPLPARTDDG